VTPKRYNKPNEKRTKTAHKQQEQTTATIMTEEQKFACVKKGLGNNTPSEQEIKDWLGRACGIQKTKEEQMAYLDSELGNALNGKGRAVLDVIYRIPSGVLISYGNLARWVNKEHGANLGPRHVASFRKRIYQTIGHDTDIPIHRIANDRDIHSTLDHPVTQEFNRIKRNDEGFFLKPVWLQK